MLARTRPVWRLDPRVAAAVVLSLCLCALALPAQAQLEEGIESWADAVSGVTNVHWAGTRVPYPTPEPRPEGLVAWRSLATPVALHVPPGTPPDRARQALEALELAHAVLAEVGQGVLAPDGGLGGDASVDVYLSPTLTEGARAAVDALEPHAYLDAANAYGLADARVPNDRLAACVTSAYAQALAMRLDPAEGESVRRSLGAYLAWLITGDLGCDDAPLGLWRDPERTFMGEEASARGAGFLALLGSRQDRNAGHWVQEVAQVARQRTWEGQDLRASPDFWEALLAVLEVHREDFAEVVDALAVARYLEGEALIAGVGTPHLAGHYDFAELPVRTRPTSLETLGSAYYLLETPDTDRDDTLRLWLRGEYGVRWALSAVRLDAQGRDLGRVSAPARDYPRSYLALTLDEATAQVLIVVTNLSSRLPDADAPDQNVRAAHLVLDKGAEASSGAAPPPAP